MVKLNYGPSKNTSLKNRRREKNQNKEKRKDKRKNLEGARKTMNKKKRDKNEIKTTKEDSKSIDKNPEKQNEDLKEIKDNLGALNEKLIQQQKQWLERFSDKITESLGGLSDDIKEDLGDLRKKIEGLGFKESKSENEFLKEIIQWLLSQQDSNNITVTTEKRNSYL
jgi:hypothetical protein